MRLPRLALTLCGILLLIAGCKQESDQQVDTSSGFKEVTLEISGMSCPTGCAPRAQEALASLPWVKDVKVNFERKQATLSAEVARLDEAALLKALADEGFEGKIVR